MEIFELQHILRALILGADKAITIEELIQVFQEERDVSLAKIKLAIKQLLTSSDPVHELKEVAGGYRYHIKEQYAVWVQKGRGKQAFIEKPSRVLNEVLAIIAYKQPITRQEIDGIRGAATNTLILEQLEEKGWIKIIGYAGAKNRAALYVTTSEFLEYFNLNSIYELPDLKEVVPV